MSFKSIIGATCICLAVVSFNTNANLIRNASFEDVPNASTGQGILPSEWIISNVTPDTYSNDGSYGLLPSGFGNFTGVTAHDGIRWVAAWSSAGQERFGQVLSENLITGVDYTMTGFLHQAVRSDINNPGGYEIYLTDTSSATPASGQYLGFLGQTSSTAEGWQQYSFSFTTTAEMSNLSFLMFAPISDISAYPGLDSVSLSAVPVPTTVWLFGSGLISLLGFARRKA